MLCLGIGLGVNMRRRVSSGDVDWTPANITTHRWYDGLDASTITETGGLISQWDDKTGNGQNCVQTTGASQPSVGTLNGLAAIEFDGVSDFFNMPTLTSYLKDVYIVSSLVGVNTNPQILSHDAINYQLRVSSGTRALRVTASALYAYYESGANEATEQITYGTPFIGGLMQGPTLSFTTNGVFEDTGTVASGSGDAPINQMGVRNGGLNFYDGTIGEMVITDNLGTSDRQKMEGYFAHRWGLTSNLPITHPYRYTTPKV